MQSDEQQAASLPAVRVPEKAEVAEQQMVRDVSGNGAEQNERIRDAVADVAEIVAPELQAERQAQTAEQEAVPLQVATAAVEAATDARVEAGARYFADEAEVYVREQLEAEEPIILTESEPGDVDVSEAETITETELVRAEAEATFEQLTVHEADNTFDFDGVLPEVPEEAFEPPVDAHEQIDALFEQFAVADDAEAYEASGHGETDGAIELDMTLEELVAELDALFGEEGYVLVNGTEVAEDINPAAVDGTTEGDISFLAGYESEGLGEEAVEEAPVAQKIESYMQKVIESEPERFAELSETEQPEVLFEEMTQIVEAVQQLADEEEALGVDAANTMELYEQRLTVVVEKLLRTLDPDFDQTQVPDIVDRLLAERPERTTATDTLTEDATHERMSEPGYDISTDNDATESRWQIGVWVTRKEFALAA